MRMESIETSSRGQKGAIMIVALVLLFVVTLLAMSGLRTASIQERMALNAQSSNVVFQHAESAVNSVLWQLQDGDKTLTDEAATQPGNNVYGEGSLGIFDDGDADALTTVQVRWLGTASVDGESRGKLGDIDPPSRYDIVGVSEVVSTGARTTVVQGIIIN